MVQLWVHGKHCGKQMKVAGTVPNFPHRKCTVYKAAEKWFHYRAADGTSSAPFFLSTATGLNCRRKPPWSMASSSHSLTNFALEMKVQFGSGGPQAASGVDPRAAQPLCRNWWQISGSHKITKYSKLQRGSFKAAYSMTLIFWIYFAFQAISSKKFLETYFFTKKCFA